MAAGSTSAPDSLIGANAFNYTCDGQRSASDHALVSGSLVGQVTGITEWHINSLEPGFLEFSTFNT